MDKIKNIIIAAALIAGVWLIGFSCGKRHFREVTKLATDTLIVVDTHVIEKPVLVERTSKETLLVAVHDTTIINDTIHVPIPIEKKIYKGEDYLAEISGYKASLDRIEVYPKTTTITKIQTKINRNSLALGAELQYYGTTYIPIYLEYSHLLHKNIQMSAKLLYDFPSKQIGVGMGMQFQIGW
jgi:S-adenosylmethionine:tRNA-ribosyltransferase-isomerase (queuine synthetase)